MEPFTLYQGDDRPRIAVAIRDANGYVDLSDSTTTVTMEFREKNTTTVLATLTGTKIAGGTLGWVYFDWGATDLDDDAARYEGQVAVSFNGSVQTVGRYYWDGTPTDYDDVIEFRIRGDF